MYFYKREVKFKAENEVGAILSRAKKQAFIAVGFKKDCVSEMNFLNTHVL